jgi:5'(3')-deoxyribonucleotidase
MWIEKHFGDLFKKKMFITHRKDMLMGDYLIDDRTANGAGEFVGEHLHFGTESCPNWDAVLTKLL